MSLNITREIFAVFSQRGASAYYGEDVSLTEHALQAAHFAQDAGAAPALVIAALLHDVGHLVAGVPENIADWIDDARHEEVGGRWLAARFAPPVSEPVRLHVPAKRYLCATEPMYASKLSPASVTTLTLQGGPMSTSEIARFEAERYCQDAIRVRRWDDLAKIVGLVTPGIEHYGPLLMELAAPSQLGYAQTADHE